MNQVCILDYGSGNVKSVYNIISFLKHKVIVSNEIKDLKSSTHIILPGVGSFGSAMKKIKENISLKALEYEIFEKKKPFFISFGIYIQNMQITTFKG